MLSLSPAVSCTSASAAVLDPAVLASLRQLQPQAGDAFLVQVLRSYLESLERHRAQVSLAWAGGQVHGVMASAHALRSASASVGAGELARLCGCVEQAGRGAQEQDQVLAGLMPGFLSELGRVADAVQDLLLKAQEIPHSAPAEEC